MERAFQWFPGHMAKAQKALQHYLKRADFLLVAVDARAPKLTLSPKITDKSKRLQIVFTKTDLADSKQTALWKTWFEQQGYRVFNQNAQNILAYLRRELSGTKKTYGIVTGMPNVGKSTLINQLGGFHKTHTGALPGVTRGPQWIKLVENLYLLDTPGIFLPKSPNLERGWRLAALGVLPEKSYSDRIVEVAECLIQYVRAHYNLFLKEPENVTDFLEAFGRKRGALSKGGVINVEEAARRLIVDFQKGKWGRTTLEEPA